MSFSTQSTGIPGTNRCELYRLAPEIVLLPEPPEGFSLAEAKRLGADSLNGQMMGKSDLFRYTGKSAPGSDQKLWQVSRAAYAAAQEIENRDGLLPCGHSGFKNIGDGQLECKRCGEVHDRSEVTDDE